MVSVLDEFRYIRADQVNRVAETVERTDTIDFEQPLDAFIDSIHSRNGFSRARISKGAAEAFDAEVEALIRPHAPDGVVRLGGLQPGLLQKGGWLLVDCVQSHVGASFRGEDGLVNTARCRVYMQAAHFLAHDLADGQPGDAEFTIGGYYDDGLVRTASEARGGWRLNAVTLTVWWRRGNEQIMKLAREPTAERSVTESLRRNG